MTLCRYCCMMLERVLSPCNPSSSLKRSTAAHEADAHAHVECLVCWFPPARVCIFTSIHDLLSASTRSCRALELRARSGCCALTPTLLLRKRSELCHLLSVVHTFSHDPAKHLLFKQAFQELVPRHKQSKPAEYVALLDHCQ